MTYTCVCMPKRQRASALEHTLQILGTSNKRKSVLFRNYCTFDYHITFLQGVRLASLEEGLLLPSREGIHGTRELAEMWSR